jgi:hypothetical protein
MSVDYAAIAAEVSNALGEVNQGTVVLKRAAVATGQVVETLISVSATVKRLHQRYEGGVLIVETGDMVTLPTTGMMTKDAGEDLSPPSSVTVTPALGDLLTIDGRDRAITNLTPIPGAGTPVMWKAWCAA